LVGSFHHGTGFAASLSTAAMTPSRIEAAPVTEPCRKVRPGMCKSLLLF
jgi:hypothetical protein